MSLNFLRILLLFVLFASCAEEKEKEKKPRPLQFEKKSIVKKAGKSCDTAEYDCTIISLEILRAKGGENVSGEINEKLEEHVIKMVSSEPDSAITDLEELSNYFISDYQNAAESFSEEPPWEAYVNQSVYKKDKDLISVGVTTEIFSGGAHGYKTLTFLNFNPETGEVYSREDLFTPEFKKYIEEIFRREQNIPLEDNINSTGFWFENDSFHLPENIGFEGDNVILVYNSYEIAPYSAGDFYMEIPVEDVKPFLKIE